jgi:glycosyltransferase involved in cell wall biosynthesis
MIPGTGYCRAAKCILCAGADLQPGHPGGAPAGAGSAARRAGGAVGRVTPEKNPALLLNAFARVVGQRPDARLVLLGADQRRRRSGVS